MSETIESSERDVRTVEQRAHIAASPATVWAFWTDPERMREWWGESAELRPEPGGVFRVVMGDAGPTMRGAYVTLEPPTRLVFTFGWEPENGGVISALVPPGSTTVEVVLTPVGDDTELLLRHTELPAGTAADEHGKGWSHFVGERLVAAAGRAPAP